MRNIHTIIPSKRFTYNYIARIRRFFVLCLLLGLSLNAPLYAESQAKEPIVKTKNTNLNVGVATLGSLKLAENHFNQIISHIDNTLLEKHQHFKSDNSQLIQFVDLNILSVWDVELTLKQLIGGKRWKSFTAAEIQLLEERFSQTLHRYVREGMAFYDGQRVKLANVKLNAKETGGLVTIRLEPIYLPAFNVSFKIAHRDDNWQLYDVIVEGISYVKMKKTEYRQIVSQKGVDGLLAHLDEKNGKNRSGVRGASKSFKTLDPRL